MQPAKDLQPLHPMIVEAVTLFNRMEEIQQQIARRAYELFEGRGYEHGLAFDDWTRAEAELLAPVAIEVSEAGNQLKLTAAVPGFKEPDIEVAVEPRRVFLSGKTEKAIGPEAEGADVTGRQAALFFQAIDLPAEVDAARAEARFEDGRLTLVLPRRAAEENVEATREIPIE